MKIVVIGGSAFSTPNLMAALCSSQSSGPNMQVVLAGRSERKLQAVSRACRLIAGKSLPISTQSVEGNDWGRSLVGADIVLIQIRVGGLQARDFDEKFPNHYGLCGDEGLGVGGLSAGWRTWPVLLPILDSVAKICPGALVILLTSPLGILVRSALQHTELKLVGICELPWTTLKQLSRRLNLPPSELQADYVGLNHLGWFFNLQCGSRNLLVPLAADKCYFPTAEFLQRYECFPTRYLRMHYEPEVVLAEQISAASSRANVLMRLREHSYQVFENGGHDEIVAALRQRNTPWYSEAVAPLLRAFRGNPVEVDFFLSARNDGYVPFLGEDDVIECRYRWRDGELTRVPLNNTPPQHVTDVLTDFVRFEQLATKAIVNRSVPLLHEALSHHPWTQNSVRVDAMVREIVSNQNVALPVGA